MKFVTGNMFEHPADARINTVNCVGVMGAGVALEFKRRYPHMFGAYKEACKRGQVTPGSLNIWKVANEWVINFPTKRHWKDDSRYEDVDSGLIALNSYLIEHPGIEVTLPALGCGHGGLDWNAVKLMIEARLVDCPASIFVFSPNDSRLFPK